MSGMFDWFKKQKKAEKGLQPRDPEAQLPSIFDPFKPNLPASVEPSDPFRSALPARPEPSRPIIPARREEPQPPSAPLEQFLAPSPPAYRPPSHPEPPPPRQEMIRPGSRGLPAMDFPPLPTPIDPVFNPGGLAFPPITEFVGKRVATHGEIRAEVKRLMDLSGDGDQAAIQALEMYFDMSGLIEDLANSMSEDVRKRWPLKEIFKETRERLNASRIVDGQALRIGRIMDIDPSRNLEEQMAELLFMNPRELRPFVERHPKEEIWDQVLYLSLYALQIAMGRTRQAQGLVRGSYWLDWSPDRSGVDIMFTPSRTFNEP